MLQTVCFIYLALTVHAGAPAKPVERTPAQVQAARQFTFEGVGLAMSRTAFLEKYPAAQPLEAQSNAKAGIQCYRLDKLQSADVADFLFLDDVLYEVTVFYTSTRLKEMGGETIPFKKLVQKLGPQDKDSPGISKKDGQNVFSARWSFSEIRTRINFMATGKMAYVSYRDTSRAGLADKRATAAAELGF